MRFEKLKKQLELLILLSDGRNYSIEELCEKMELSRRNFYYLLDFIKHAGFIVNAGGATAQDVLCLIDEVREAVYKHSGVLLEPEVRLRGRQMKAIK